MLSYRHHTSYAFVSRVFCPNAENESKSDFPITEKYLTNDIFRLDARAVKRIQVCVAIFMLVAVYIPRMIFFVLCQNL